MQPRRRASLSLRLVVPCNTTGSIGEGVSVLNKFGVLSLLLLLDLGFMDGDDLPFFSCSSNLFTALFLLQFGFFCTSSLGGKFLLSGEIWVGGEKRRGARLLLGESLERALSRQGFQQAGLHHGHSV